MNELKPDSAALTCGDVRRALCEVRDDAMLSYQLTEDNDRASVYYEQAQFCERLMKALGLAWRT